jgi:hypothetical protein
MQNDRRTKQWEIPRRLYWLAQITNPQFGNSFNQLAVIDTYEGKELDAITMYFRSLVCQNPFTTATENILILFAKVKSKKDRDVIQDFVVLLSNFTLPEFR